MMMMMMMMKSYREYWRPGKETSLKQDSLPISHSHRSEEHLHDDHDDNDDDEVVVDDDGDDLLLISHYQGEELLHDSDYNDKE